MQEIRPSHYIFIGYNAKEQPHDSYMRKKRLLENNCEIIKSKIKENEITHKILVVNTIYSEEKNLCACVYKNHLFLGFQVRENNTISFFDSGKDFLDVPNNSFLSLSVRMTNAIQLSNKGKDNRMSQQLRPMWEKITPILDAILTIEQKYTMDPSAPFLEQQKIDEIINVLYEYESQTIRNHYEGALAASPIKY